MVSTRLLRLSRNGMELNFPSLSTSDLLLVRQAVQQMNAQNHHQ